MKKNKFLKGLVHVLQIEKTKTNGNDFVTSVLNKFLSGAKNNIVSDILHNLSKFISSKAINDISNVEEFKLFIAVIIKEFASITNIYDVLHGASEGDEIASFKFNGTDAMPTPNNLLFNFEMTNPILTELGHQYAGVTLQPTQGKIYITKEAASLLVFLFNQYYSNNTPVNMGNIVEHLRMIAASKEKVKVTPTNFNLYDRPIMKKVADTSPNIYDELNNCLIHFDFLNVSDGPKNETKKLIMEYMYYLTGTNRRDVSEQFDAEHFVWSLWCSEVGEMTTLNAIKVSGALTDELKAWVIINGFVFTEKKYEASSAFDHLLANYTAIKKLADSGKYTTENPYQSGMKRCSKGNLKINHKKLGVLRTLLSEIQPR